MSRYLYDAIIVLSGGLTPEGVPNPWVAARLDTAISVFDECDNCWLVLNSRCTPHKLPIVTASGHVVDESVAAAKYVVERYGVDSSRILLDSWSVDTIGNAYFFLMNHIVPLELRNVLVITSSFHVNRARIIFEHIFGLHTQWTIQSHFMETEDTGMPPNVLAARVAKEADSMTEFSQKTIPQIQSIKELTKFVFVKHRGYSFELERTGVLSMDNPDLVQSY